MSDLVVAQFDTQFEASAALDRLIARGVRRRSAFVCSSESVGGSAASSSAPTTVVSRVSHHAAPDRATRAPADMRPPMQVGQATLTIELSGLVTLEEIMKLMQDAGARGVHVLVNQKPPVETAALAPDVEYGRPGDVARATSASRSGLR